MSEQFGAGGGKVFCDVATWAPVGILRTTSANGVNIIERIIVHSLRVDKGSGC